MLWIVKFRSDLVGVFSHSRELLVFQCSIWFLRVYNKYIRISNLGEDCTTDYMHDETIRCMDVRMYCTYVSVLSTGWIYTHNGRVLPLLPQATARQCRSTPSRTPWRPCGWACRTSWPTGPRGWLEHMKSTSLTETLKSCWIGCRWDTGDRCLIGPWCWCVGRGKNGWGFWE